MNRYFADISNNNSQVIDWGKYHDKGQHILVGEKASEGLTFIDKTQPRRSEGAHAAGVWVIHYHFGHVGKSPADQAKFFWDQTKNHFAGKDFACIDIEGGGMDGHNARDTANWLRTFDREFRRISGHSLIGYCNESLLREIVRAGGTVSGDRWWIAAYGPIKPIIASIKTWAWQYTDGVEGPEPHVYAGVGKCDGSILNRGTYTRLRLARPPR